MPLPLREQDTFAEDLSHPRDRLGWLLKAIWILARDLSQCLIIGNGELLIAKREKVADDAAVLGVPPALRDANLFGHEGVGVVPERAAGDGGNVAEGRDEEGVAEGAVDDIDGEEVG